MSAKPEQDGFPDHRDLVLQARADRLVGFAEELQEWVGRHARARREGTYPIRASDEFQLLRLRRLASNLWNSTKVPVASAVYGASQVGKSLFMGRVLEPADQRDTPLGKSDKLAPDAYIRELSFRDDLNPQAGSKEATALVTRFTTQERFDPEALPEYPVKVRALSRAEWIRVLARGFRSESPQREDIVWEEGQMRNLFENASKSHGAEETNREWQMDLVDAYAFMRAIDRRQYQLDESLFNSFLSQYPLKEQGYVEVAGRLFWDSGLAGRETFANITSIFNDVNRFLQKISAHGRDGILVHWGAVKFLLDSQRSKEHAVSSSRWKKQMRWTDFTAGFKDGWYVIDYREGAGGPEDDLAIIQSAMLEMIIPVVPHRLNSDWRDVIKQMDVLDLPGMRSSGGDSQGKDNLAKDLDQKMALVKRGKVFYLIERYIEERQVQTLLMLVRGGNLEVRQLLKQYVDKWGQTRYGEENWPKKVDDPHPALFIGMTGIDEEFRNRPAFDNNDLYNHRLTELVSETLTEVMTDFGGAGRPFTNVYPIRYPGSWDAAESEWNADPQRKWDAAGKAFVTSSQVQRYVADPERRWQAAMRDNDGGLTLISQGFLGCTSSLQKQDSLEHQLKTVSQEVRNLAQAWYVDPNTNLDREKRMGLARKVIAWLEHEEYVYERVHALQHSLCFEVGHAMDLAEFAEPVRRGTRRGSVEDRFPDFLQEVLKQWATQDAPERWQKYTEGRNVGAPWLDADDFGAFARYLWDYLRTEAVFRELSNRLLSVVTLQIDDQGARRHARREYVLLVLNDYVLNPGPSPAPLETVASNDLDLDLMEPFVRRWRGRLPQALASAAGQHTEIPSGNDELHQILTAT